MTIFEILNSLLFSKKPLELNLENEKDFSLYMVNRWVSMYSPEKADLINSTINKWWNVFQTKQEQFDFLFVLFGQNNFKRIDYLKKKKSEKPKKDSEDLNFEKQAAHNNFMSVAQYRELQLLVSE